MRSVSKRKRKAQVLQYGLLVKIRKVRRRYFSLEDKFDIVNKPNRHQSLSLIEANIDVTLVRDIIASKDVNSSPAMLNTDSCAERSLLVHLIARFSFCGEYFRTNYLC